MEFVFGGLERSTRAIWSFWKLFKCFGAVLFCCALNERIPHAEPKTPVGFGVTNYPNKKAGRLLPTCFFGAGKRT